MAVSCFGYLSFGMPDFQYLRELTITISGEIPIKPRKESKLKKIKYYIFCICWLWKNKEWSETRQKYKAMNREYEKHLSEVARRTK